MDEMARLRVCHVVAPAPVGGLEAVVALLAAGMARRGHEVQVLALLGPEGCCHAFEALGNAGVGVVEVRLPGRSYRAEARRLVAELSGGAPVIAHSHGYHADLVGLRAARRSGCPIVSTAHGFLDRGAKGRFYEWLDRRALARFDAVVAVSRPLAGRLASAGVGDGRLHVIPNAFALPSRALTRAEARRVLGIPPEARVAGWVGRLSPEKGPDLFLEALALAPDWNGSIIGAGELLPALKERARSTGVASRVRWHGMVPDAGTLLSAFDALVLSSRTEGTPIILLEGMAAGVPLVVTAVGGVPDVVGNGEAVVVPAPEAAALAMGLQSVFADPGAAAARARAARERLEAKHSIEPWLDRYETVYREIGAMQPSRTTRA